MSDPKYGERGPDPRTKGHTLRPPTETEPKPKKEAEPLGATGKTVLVVIGLLILAVAIPFVIRLWQWALGQ